MFKDVIGEVTFSKPFGFMDMAGDDGAFKQIEGALGSAAWIGQTPWLYWLHDRLMPYVVPLIEPPLDDWLTFCNVKATLGIIWE